MKIHQEQKKISHSQDVKLNPRKSRWRVASTKFPIVVLHVQFVLIGFLIIVLDVPFILSKFLIVVLHVPCVAWESMCKEIWQLHRFFPLVLTKLIFIIFFTSLNTFLQEGFFSQL
jgi:hypothetical protein